MKRRILLAPILALALLLLIAAPVLAIAAPDSGPFIIRVDVYRHFLEDDDMLVVVRYDVPYASLPTETIMQAYIGRFMDGSTELVAISPYAYYRKGYDEGSYSMYLGSGGASWEGSYTAELNGNPTLEWQAPSASSAVVGAVADDGGSQTDETTAANNSTENDMTLLPATPAINDAYYFGDDSSFDILKVNIGTQGEGAWLIVWEYWDGEEWTALSGVTDGTTHFRAAPGNRNVSFTLPSDWEKCEVKVIDAYWIRARVYSYTSKVTAPKGTQCWTNVTVPEISTSMLNWHSTANNSATKALLYSHLISWADDLGDYWSIALTTETSSGTKLSTYGEQYFVNVIPGLRTACPSLFRAGLDVPAYEGTEWQRTQIDVLKGTWPLDWSGIGTWFGIESEEVFRTLIFLVIMMAVVIIVVHRSGKPELGVFIAFPAIIVAGATGWISVVFAVILTFTCILAFGFVAIWARSGA